MLKQTFFRPMVPQKDYSELEADLNLDEIESIDLAWRAEQSLISTKIAGIPTFVGDGVCVTRLKDVSINKHLLSSGVSPYAPVYDATRRAVHAESANNYRYPLGYSWSTKVPDRYSFFPNPKSGLPFLFIFRGEWSVVPTATAQVLYNSQDGTTGVFFGFDPNTSSTDLLFIIRSAGVGTQYIVQVVMDTDPHTWTIYSDGSTITFEQDGIIVDTAAVGATTIQPEDITATFLGWRIGSYYPAKDFYWYGVAIKNGAATAEERAFWRSWVENIPE